MEKNYELDDLENCPLANVQKILRGKWPMVIIYLLSKSTLRFGELSRKLPHVTQANLTKELRMLEEFKLIHREVYKEVPPKVEYSLTDLGINFLPVLEALEKWAIEYDEGTKLCATSDKDCTPLLLSI